MYALLVHGLNILWLLQVLKTSVSQDSAEQSLVLSNYQKLNSCLRKKIFELENEKVKFPFYFDIFLEMF